MPGRLVFYARVAMRPGSWLMPFTSHAIANGRACRFGQLCFGWNRRPQTINLCHLGALGLCLNRVLNANTHFFHSTLNRKQVPVKLIIQSNHNLYIQFYFSSGNCSLTCFKEWLKHSFFSRRPNKNQLLINKIDNKLWFLFLLFVVADLA